MAVPWGGRLGYGYAYAYTTTLPCLAHTYILINLAKGTIALAHIKLKNF